MFCPSHGREITEDECHRTLAGNLDTGDTCPLDCPRLAPDEHQKLKAKIRTVLKGLLPDWPQEHLDSLVCLGEAYPQFQDWGQTANPRRSVLRRALQDLVGKAHAFANALDSLPERALKAMGIDADIYSKANHYAALIEARAHRGLSFVIDDKGGRPKEQALNNWLLNLMEVFERVTGQEPGYTYRFEEADPYAGTPSREEYSGPFIEIAWGLLTAIGELPQSKNALGQRIKSLLPLHRKRKGFQPPSQS